MLGALHCFIVSIGLSAPPVTSFLLLLLHKFWLTSIHVQIVFSTLRYSYHFLEIKKYPGIYISSEDWPRWKEECRRPVSISRAFFCKRSEYLCRDVFIFWEIFIFGEIFILLIFLLQQVGIFIFWEIFIWRNIYLQTKFNSEKYLFNHGSQYFDSYNLYHGPGIWFVYILDCRSPLTERLICSDNEKTLLFLI